MGFDFSVFVSRIDAFQFIPILQLVVFLLLAVVGWRLRKLIKQYRSLLSGRRGVNLEEVLLELSKRSKKVEERLDMVEKELGDSQKAAQSYLKHWSLVRYKAFANTGGDQSFSLVLLDENNDGFVLSSIYGRDESRIYAKTIKDGKSGYPLSDEEEEILNKVIRNKKKAHC